ncbi:hypothetical protein J4Q44_G00300340 [Coregonus suidteri]|uniref:B30.2/SPRY domain-containing protein n=1 Tax=Coregonus suidteri TaxID=861788 RepID=A0AAN8LAL2_9TELE
MTCDNRKVNFHTEYSCGTAAIRGSKELADGQHFWEIKMTSPVYGTDMMVGIGTCDVNLDKYRHTFCSLLGKDDDSWGLSYTGIGGGGSKSSSQSDEDLATSISSSISDPPSNSNSSKFCSICNEVCCIIKETR